VDDAQLDRLKAVLTEELTSVETQLADYEDSPGQGIDVSSEEGFADSAQATAERSSLISLIEQLQASRREVADALARIEQGTYGKCERCGNEIPHERLEALPSARLCVACKQATTS
jgi:RNA polymerase-binding transcription factor DksA